MSKICKFSAKIFQLFKFSIRVFDSVAMKACNWMLAVVLVREYTGVPYFQFNDMFRKFSAEKVISKLKNPPLRWIEVLCFSNLHFCPAGHWFSKHSSCLFPERSKIHYFSFFDLFLVLLTFQNHFINGVLNKLSNFPILYLQVFLHRKRVTTQFCWSLNLSSLCFSKLVRYAGLSRVYKLSSIPISIHSQLTILPFIQFLLSAQVNRPLMCSTNKSVILIQCLRF